MGTFVVNTLYMFASKSWKIFNESIDNYHLLDLVDPPFHNPYSIKEVAYLLYKKNWIDTVQWHYEDIIRDPTIDSLAALKLKRSIDASNQERTDLVEFIDAYFYKEYQTVHTLKSATMNTESPAWAIDRLSILALKVFHMREEVSRETASEAHRQQCQEKLTILLTQKEDLCLAIDQLLADIAAGRKYMKVYKQMKMYNDQDLNPVLRAHKK
jgi:hypothetical protein